MNVLIHTSTSEPVYVILGEQRPHSNWLAPAYHTGDQAAWHYAKLNKLNLRTTYWIDFQYIQRPFVIRYLRPVTDGEMTDFAQRMVEAIRNRTDWHCHKWTPHGLTDILCPTCGRYSVNNRCVFGCQADDNHYQKAIALLGD